MSREAQQCVDRKRIREELISQTEAALLAVFHQPTAQVWRSILNQIDHVTARDTPADADAEALLVALARAFVRQETKVYLETRRTQTRRTA